MKRKKMLWLFGMAALCLVLFTIIDARLENTSSVIMGGAQGAYVTSDTVTFEDPNAEAEPTAEDLLDWPEVDFEDPSNQYRMVRDETNFLLSSVFIPEDLTEIPGYRLSISSVALPYLEALMDAAKEAGFTIYVAGAYRTYGHQNYLFNSKASQIAAGMGIDDYM
ncbi:MAG: D-alanyl-D-alanine carboxypeptidase family protein, partial [Firmicutes bacterium]|nr:D-alanyl-D-alanine carboxypeptidase family protein [Bacillota bacterium]MDY6161125.1 hypothetical protein [Candidatus Faecousia sp.]